MIEFVINTYQERKERNRAFDFLKENYSFKMRYKNAEFNSGSNNQNKKENNEKVGFILFLKRIRVNKIIYKVNQILISK